MNIIIGANGAGKSNLLSFFKLLNWMTFAPDQLQFYIGKVGGANSLLHDGARTTPQIQALLTFDTEKGKNEYELRLFHAASDTLIFAEERIRFQRNDVLQESQWKSLGSGHRESNLLTAANDGDQTAKVMLNLLRGCVSYQFHNTSDTARMKQRWDVEDSRYLKDDGANLAAFLYRMRSENPKYYERILLTIRQIAPFISDFVLEPSFGTILLQWRERNSDMVFGPHQISDGTLRAILLVALLLQPEMNLPDLIILDEPELGLHPYAIEILAGLLQSVALKTQIIAATQSASLLDYFDAEDILVAERSGRESHFERLSSDKLEDWLDEYTLSELWRKNVIGGGPV
ncbi:MAG: AAA family ATPase [Caldilineaceae bacterium]